MDLQCRCSRRVYEVQGSSSSGRAVRYVEYSYISCTFENPLGVSHTAMRCNWLCPTHVHHRDGVVALGGGKESHLAELCDAKVYLPWTR